MTGQTLGHYQVLEKIGSGGMGEVYRARDERLARDVALKLLKPSLAHDQDRLRRFEQEARAAAALNHPNIVAIYDIGFHEGAPYIVSELLEGLTLRQKLVEGPLTLRQTADYSLQIAHGLVAAHDKRIVHRDLKPENLFVTRDGRVKILDFGIAKLTLPEATEDRSVANLTTQTKSGSILGTVAYMSPEQLRGKSVDARSDIFSFGAILYEMMVGHRAFAGETEVDTITAVLKEEPPEMVVAGQNIPPAFEHIIRHCLEKEPENRFQSARDLAFALSTATETATSRIGSRTQPRRIEKWLPWLAGAAAIVALAMFVGSKLRPVEPPNFLRLTFERGTIYSARFTPDGRNVLYGASWSGRPLEIYTTLSDAPQSRSLGIASSHMLALSHSNELAIVLHGEHGSRLDFINGTLARTPLAGGAPREIEQDVRWADWDTKGELAVAHHANGHIRLEYPVGKVLYETTGDISYLRFSPDGRKIAFMDHPGRYDDRGSIAVIDLEGHKATLTPQYGSEDGLAWSPSGDEVWFTAADRGYDRTLWGVTLSGHMRKILTAAGGLTLHDVAPDGRVLASFDNERVAMEWTGKDPNKVEDLTWYNWTIPKDISRDGQWVLFEESSEPAGSDYAVGIRKIDGSPPIRLGDGSAGGLSPDGKWAIAVSPGSPVRLKLLPVGPGQPREIALPGLERIENGSAHFLPSGEGILFDGQQQGHLDRTYLVDLSGDPPKPVTPEGVHAGLPSPDGKYLVGGSSSNHNLAVFSFAGGSAIQVPIDDGFSVAQWSDDSKGVYVYRVGDVPMKVYRCEIASGKMTPIRDLIPPDPAGVVSLAPVVTNFQGSAFAYSPYQTLSVLYLISGLK
jgi:serine/threonine protein kinase